MAQAERRAEEKKANKRERSKEGRSRRAAAAGEFNLLTVDWISLMALAMTFAVQGGALRIGYTRDGGALALGCYIDDDYATEYIRPNEDFDSALIDISRAWLGGQEAAFLAMYEALLQDAKERTGR